VSHSPAGQDTVISDTRQIVYFKFTGVTIVSRVFNNLVDTVQAVGPSAYFRRDGLVKYLPLKPGDTLSGGVAHQPVAAMVTPRHALRWPSIH